MDTIRLPSGGASSIVPSMKSSLLNAIVDAGKGSLIGAANTIPGVSGGTIAVVTGLYDRLIASVSGFFRNGWRTSLRFLVPVALGVGIGVLAFARLIDAAMTRFPSQTSLLFVGLILGSIPYIARVAVKDGARPAYLIAFVPAVAILVLMAIVAPPAATQPLTDLTLQSAILVFVAGAISSATMIIPGISGSFVLLLIGMYSTFIRAARDFNLPLLAVLLPGLLVGVVVVSKAINYLLTKHHGWSYAAILGLVVGSLAPVWPRVGGAWYLPEGIATGAIDLLAIGVGTGLALLLGSGRKDQHQRVTVKGGCE